MIRTERQPVEVRTEKDGKLVVVSAPDEAVVSPQLLDAAWRDDVNLQGLDYDSETRLFVIHAYDGDYTYRVDEDLDFRSQAHVMHRVHEDSE